MKFLRFLGSNNEIRIGVECDRGIVDIEKTAEHKGVSMQITMNDIIKEGKIFIDFINDILKDDVTLLTDAFQLLPPVEIPEKILCVGLNYSDHRKECDEFPDSPKDPVLFSKFANALAAHNEEIPLSPVAKQYDYEAELVIVIGKDAKDVTPEQAPEYIFGYTAGNDVSARDLQFQSGQWLIGKSMDKFAPIGPRLVTADELDVGNLAISCSLNGEVRQSANTSQMIFSPAQIVSYASKIMTLKSGDLIFTGTPAGVILGMTNPDKEWIKSGDTVEVTIEGIGTLRNKFI
ncbi:MAG: fumarylacetoacetate hydrolase family protein [Oscillospiraceae bacterium]